MLPIMVCWDFPLLNKTLLKTIVQTSVWGIKRSVIIRKYLELSLVAAMAMKHKSYTSLEPIIVLIVGFFF